MHKHHKEWKNLSHIFLAQKDGPDSCSKMLYDEALPVEWLTEWKHHIAFCPYKYIVYSSILEFEKIHHQTPSDTNHPKALGLRLDLYNQLTVIVRV